MYIDGGGSDRSAIHPVESQYAVPRRQGHCAGHKLIIYVPGIAKYVSILLPAGKRHLRLVEDLLHPM